MVQYGDRIFKTNIIIIIIINHLLFFLIFLEHIKHV